MRILTITTLFPNHLQPNLGVFIKHRIVALSKLADVRVIAPIPWVPAFAGFTEKARLFQQINNEEIIDGIKVYHPRYFVTPRFGRNLYGKFYYFSLIQFVKKLYSSFPFDVLDIHWAYPDGYAGVLLAKKLRKPVSVSLRGTDIHTYPNCPSRRRLIAYSLSHADMVIAVSSSMIPLVKELGINHHRISVIPNGIDRKIFHFTTQEAARKDLSIKKTDKVILTVGRFEAPKRFDLLINSIAQLMHDNNLPIKLILVGDGSLGPDLVQLAKEKGIADQIIFAGEQPNDALAKWYGMADIFCLASDKEGCPNVVLEALSCGVPVVASDVGNVKEILSSTKYGIIVDENNIIAWSKSIHLALSTNWNPEEIAYSLEGKGWEVVGEDIYKTFSQIIKVLPTT